MRIGKKALSLVLTCAMATSPFAGAGAFAAEQSTNTNVSSNVKIDTGKQLTVQKGGTYQFKVTAPTKPKFVCGNGSVFRVDANGSNGNDYFFKVTAIGEVGQGAGFYVNDEKVPRTVGVISAGEVTLDTGKQLFVPEGGTYQFKVTAPTKPRFVCGNGSVFKVVENGSSGNDYFFKVIAVGKTGESAGFYVNDEKTPRTIGTIGTNHSSDIVLNTGEKFSVEQGKTYQIQVTAPSKPTLVCGSGSVFKVVDIGSFGNDYFFNVTAIGQVGQSAGFYVNNESTPRTIGTIVSASKSSTSSTSSGSHSSSSHHSSSGSSSSSSSEATVSTSEELKTALETSSIRKIYVTSNLTGDVTATTESKYITIDFDGYQLSGSLNITADNANTVHFYGDANPAITGDLTVNAPDASVSNEITVGGTVNVQDVDSNSWYEEADGNKIIVTDNNGANIKIDGKPASVTVANGADEYDEHVDGIKIQVHAPVAITVNDKAVVDEIHIESDAAGTSITNCGTINNVRAGAKANIVVQENAKVGEIEISSGANATNITNNGTVTTVKAYANISIENNSGTIGLSGIKDITVSVSGTAADNVKIEEGSNLDIFELNSTIEQDPGKTGGPSAEVSVDGKTITFGGTIAYYDADDSLGRSAGHRVGVKVTAPTGITPGNNTKLIVDNEKTYDGKDIFEDGENFFYFYPLVTKAGQTITFTVQWAENIYDTFTIKIDNDATLETAEDQEALEAVLEDITGDSNVLTVNFNKPVFLGDTPLSEVEVETAEDKINFLKAMFRNAEELSEKYMNADAVTIELTDTQIKLTVGDNAINEDIFKELDTSAIGTDDEWSGNDDGVYRMDVALNLDSFQDAEGATAADVDSFKIKFFIEQEDGVVDYDDDIHAVFQTVEQAKEDELPASSKLVATVEDITGKSNVLTVNFNKPVFLGDTPLSKVKVETAEDKIAFLQKMFRNAEELSTDYMNADAVTIELTDTQIKLTVGDNAINKDIFKALDNATTGGIDKWSGNEDGVYRMDVALNLGSFKDAAGESAADVDAFKIKFTSLNLGFVDYDADIKAVFQTQEQRDAEIAADTGVSLTVKDGATKDSATVHFESTRPFGTSETQYSGNYFPLYNFTKNGVYMLLRLYKDEDGEKTPVFFNTVFKGVKFKNLLFGDGLAYGSVTGMKDASSGRKGGDFGVSGIKNSTYLFSDCRIKDSQFAGALIYDVKVDSQDIYPLWLPAGSVDLSITTEPLESGAVPGEYEIDLEVYKSAYKAEGSEYVKYSNDDEVPLLAKEKIVSFTVEDE
jgi:acyl dehydratase